MPGRCRAGATGTTPGSRSSPSAHRRRRRRSPPRHLRPRLRRQRRGRHRLVENTGSASSHSLRTASESASRLGSRGLPEKYVRQLARSQAVGNRAHDAPHTPRGSRGAHRQPAGRPDPPSTGAAASVPEQPVAGTVPPRQRSQGAHPAGHRIRRAVVQHSRHDRRACLARRGRSVGDQRETWSRMSPGSHPARRTSAGAPAGRWPTCARIWNSWRRPSRRSRALLSSRFPAAGVSLAP